MTPLRRAAVLLAATLATALPVGGAALADDDDRGTRDNVATATIERDGGRDFDAAFSIVQQRGGAVEQLNAARALARCTDCRAVAIAFQIVLVSGTPSSLAPVNQAIAVNDQCTRCTVYAGARQFVRVTDRPVRITPAGRRTLLDVGRDLLALERSNADAAGLAAEVEAQEARVLDVLQTQLVPADGGGRPRETDREDDEADDRG